jgi:tetratricopeptide (TPR) repeat protein
MLKLYRRNGIIPTFVSISFNYQKNEINIYTDAGRLSRPIYYIENLKFSYDRKEIRELLESGNITWEQIVSGFMKKSDENFKSKSNKIYELIELYKEIGTDREEIFRKLEKYKSAIENLNKVINEGSLNKEEKIRYRFILGQLYMQANDNKNAILNFNKVINLVPSYDFGFNANINITKLYDVNDKKSVNKVRRSLKKMANDDKNIDVKLNNKSNNKNRFRDNIVFDLDNTLICAVPFSQLHLLPADLPFIYHDFIIDEINKYIYYIFYYIIFFYVFIIILSAFRSTAGDHRRVFVACSPRRRAALASPLKT